MEGGREKGRAVRKKEGGDEGVRQGREEEEREGGGRQAGCWDSFFRQLIWVALSILGCSPSSPAAAPLNLAHAAGNAKQERLENLLHLGKVAHRPSAHL